MQVNLMTGLLGGGAANAARQLHEGLLDQGVRSRLYYSPRVRSDEAPAESAPAQWAAPAGGRLRGYLGYRLHRIRFKRAIRNRPAGNEIFTSPRGAAATAWPPPNHPAADDDILHLHWVAKFIDYATFFGSLGPDLPVVWTLHDMNPITGGCHYAGGCRRFVEGCGHCPQLSRSGADDISRETFLAKQAAVAGVNLHVVAASRWLLEEARRSPILGSARSFHRIPYGLRLNDYPVVPKREARARLGLDPDAFLFSFGAADIENRRKGIGLLMTGLQRVAALDRVQGLVLGEGRLPAVETPLPPLQAMGFVREAERRALIFSACDAFVLSSTEDNLPLTGLEAMAAGTPIVGFDAGGIPDYARHGETGLLAAKGDALGLGDQLRRLVGDRERATAMGRQARRVVEAEYGDVREAEAYLRLYRELLEARRRDTEIRLPEPLGPSSDSRTRRTA